MIACWMEVSFQKQLRWVSSSVAIGAIFMGCYLGCLFHNLMVLWSPHPRLGLKATQLVKSQMSTCCRHLGLEGCTDRLFECQDPKWRGETGWSSTESGNGEANSLRLLEVIPFTQMYRRGSIACFCIA